MPRSEASFRIIAKTDASESWTELAACWALPNSESFSAKLNVAAINALADGSDTVKALLVANKPLK